MIDALVSLIMSPKVLGALGGLAAILLGAFGIYRKGRTDERRKSDSARLQAMKDKKEIDDEVDQLGPADLDSRFDRWRVPDDRR